MLDSAPIKQKIIDAQAGVSEYAKGEQRAVTHENISVICTQPRRMAAMSMANRVCKERNKDLG